MRIVHLRILVTLFFSATAFGQGICAVTLKRPQAPVFQAIDQAMSKTNSHHERNEATLYLVHNLNAEIDNLAADIEDKNPEYFNLDDSVPADKRPIIKITRQQNQAAVMIHLVTKMLGIPDEQIDSIMTNRLALRIPRKITERHIGFVLPKSPQPTDAPVHDELPYGRLQMPEPREASAHLPIGFIYDLNPGSAPQGFIGFTKPTVADDSFVYQIVPNVELALLDIVRINVVAP